MAKSVWQLGLIRNPHPVLEFLLDHAQGCCLVNGNILHLHVVHASKCGLLPAFFFFLSFLPALLLSS